MITVALIRKASIITIGPDDFMRDGALDLPQATRIIML